MIANISSGAPHFAKEMRIAMIINPNVVTLSNEQLKTISAAEPATIGHFRNFGFNNQPLFISLPGRRFIGRAVTVKLASNDSTLLHKVTEMVGPGDVLVIDRAGDQQYAALGGVVSWALHVSGVEGVIVDGAATDIDEIREYGLVVLYRRLSAITTRLFGLDGEINTPVVCCGVSVNPGDIVLGDENGFVVLAPEEAEAVCKRAIEIQATEPGKRERIAKGEHMADITRAGALIKEYFAKNA
ncbi:MAG: hypothetical protein J6Z30_08100 [Pyramidobacter sp.]|nr:hypothetical protein [Pyramidobacter sp.]